MRYFLITVFFTLMALPVMAQTVQYSECKTLAEYMPQAGVNYEPGVDVNGKSVAPADLNAAPFEMPDVMSIPLSIDLARRLPDPPQGMEADASVGFLEVHKDGRIVFEGKDWTPQVYAICRGEPMPPVVSEDGQKPSETVESAPAKATDRYN